jgi:hypothetical protein
MNLMIPDIGDRLVLTKPWSFDLYPERRNATLLAYLGLSQYFTVEPNASYREDDRRRTEETLQKVGHGGDTNHFHILWKGVELNAPNQAHYFSGYGDKPLIEAAVIPRGFTLRVDRIYIRKGAKDFSSVSFYLEGAHAPGAILHKKAIKITGGQYEHYTREVKAPKSAVRFWAKLCDVNTMKVELVETS